MFTRGSRALRCAVQHAFLDFKVFATPGPQQDFVGACVPGNALAFAEVPLMGIVAGHRGDLVQQQVWDGLL